MGFFDKVKNAVNFTAKKVGEFGKKVSTDFKEYNEKREQEAKEKEKVDAENAKLKAIEEGKQAQQQKVETENLTKEQAKAEEQTAKPEEVKSTQPVEKTEKLSKESLDEEVKNMFCKPTKQELKDELALLHRINAIDNDNIYVGGPVNFKTKETSLGSFFKTNKDKTFLSYRDGVFFCTYFNHEEKFMVYKYFLKDDVGSAEICTETMEKKITVIEKDGFPLLTLDVTDNTKCLEVFKQLLK